MIHASTAYCFDLDSTLRNSRHRHGKSPATDPSATWEDYSALGEYDTPMPGPIRIMQDLHRFSQIHIVSASEEAARAVTMAWLRVHVKSGWDFVALSVKDKPDYVKSLQAKGIDVRAFWEDWPPNARAITEQTGVPAIIVNPVYPCLACGYIMGDEVPRDNAS